MVLEKGPSQLIYKQLRVLNLVQDTCAAATAVAEAFVYLHYNTLEDHYARKHQSRKLIPLSAQKDRWSSLQERISLRFELLASRHRVVNSGQSLYGITKVSATFLAPTYHDFHFQVT